MSLLNQICRQITREINKSQSKLFPDGVILPPDLIDKIVFEYLLPELWYVPLDLQQDCISTQPSLFGCDYCIHGRWKQRIPTRDAPRIFYPSVLSNSNYHFEICEKVDPRLPSFEECYGSDSQKIMQKMKDQGNWSKVQILNYMRSIECPVLGNFDEKRKAADSNCVRYCQRVLGIPVQAEEEDRRYIPRHRQFELGFIRSEPRPVLCSEDRRPEEFMELRELTEEDVRKRGVGSLEDTKQKDKLLLKITLDEIIRNNQDIDLDLLGESRIEAEEREDAGWRYTTERDRSYHTTFELLSKYENGSGNNCIIWHPMINGVGHITFTTR